MLPEEEYDTEQLEQLEHDFRLSHKQFRALLRWGIDKAFHETSLSTQELLVETRKLLDKKSTEYTAILLEKVAHNLREMEQTYADKKVALLNYSNATIHFLEKILTEMPNTEPSDTQAINERNKFVQALEQARLASQNDDWSQAEEITHGIINHYLGDKQANLAINNPLAALPADALQKIEEQLLKGAFCKLLSLNELQHTFASSTASQVATTKIAILSDDTYIKKLFSFLSNKELQFTGKQQTSEICAALLRISASRNHVVYITGIAVNLLDSMTQLRPLLGELSAVLLNLEENTFSHTDIEENLFICLEQLPQSQIYRAGQASSLLTDQNEPDSLQVLKENYLPNVTQTDIIEWIKNIYLPQQ